MQPQRPQLLDPAFHAAEDQVAARHGDDHKKQQNRHFLGNWQEGLALKQQSTHEVEAIGKGEGQRHR